MCSLRLTPSPPFWHHAQRIHRVYLERLRILGLRSMYFAVAGLLKIFRFLHYGLAVVLMLLD